MYNRCCWHRQSTFGMTRDNAGRLLCHQGLRRRRILVHRWRSWRSCQTQSCTRTCHRQRRRHCTRHCHNTMGTVGYKNCRTGRGCRLYIGQYHLLPSRPHTHSCRLRAARRCIGHFRKADTCRSRCQIAQAHICIRRLRQTPSRPLCRKHCKTVLSILVRRRMSRLRHFRQHMCCCGNL